jgi:hypothetical protein
VEAVPLKVSYYQSVGLIKFDVIVIIHNKLQNQLFIYKQTTNLYNKNYFFVCKYFQITKLHEIKLTKAVINISNRFISYYSFILVKYLKRFIFLLKSLLFKNYLLK